LLKNLGPPEHENKTNLESSLKVRNAAITMLKKDKLGQFSFGIFFFFSVMTYTNKTTHEEIVAQSYDHYCFFGEFSKSFI
jgi:hypothetical protein